MPASPDSSALYLRDTADFLSVVPYLLGFHPTLSLVAVVFDADVFKGVVRFDLPECSVQSPDLADACARIIAQHALPNVLFIGYGPGWQVTPIMDAVFTTATASGIEIIDAIRCEDGRYWSYVCMDPSCCSPDGVPYDTTSNPAALAAVLAGYAAAPDRETFRQRLAPVVGPDRDAISDATTAARARAVNQLDSTDWFGEGLQRIREGFDHVRAGRPIPADEVAWLGVLLTGIFVRDIALTLCHEYGEELSMQLWVELTRRVEPEFVPAPAANLAFLAMRSGDGALARVAVDRALAVDREYSFANMILWALNEGIPPEPISAVDFAEMATRITEIAAEYPSRARPVLPPAPRPELINPPSGAGLSPAPPSCLEETCPRNPCSGSTRTR
ncbi:DUF4192 domain-containing protein [Nonomuraea sp. 10N515B]|uniref:DUF4192 domain-containing protein n=1 Tax=Nonomuraea sp. 10N515B TaxID=3457422 RepID=UPI003FCDFACB